MLLMVDLIHDFNLLRGRTELYDSETILKSGLLLQRFLFNVFAIWIFIIHFKFFIFSWLQLHVLDSRLHCSIGFLCRLSYWILLYSFTLSVTHLAVSLFSSLSLSKSVSISANLLIISTKALSCGFFDCNLIIILKVTIALPSAWRRRNLLKHYMSIISDRY